MENKNNNDIENTIFLSIKEKGNILSPEELEKIISDKLIANGYEDWQAHYGVERIKKMIKKENIVPKSVEEEKKEKVVKNVKQWQLFGYIIILGNLGFSSFSNSWADLPIYWRAIGILFGIILIFAGEKDLENVKQKNK